MSRPVVVKVGGSLLDWSELPLRLGSYLVARHSDRLILVVGGGGAADVVRALDRVHALGDDRSHALALRALDLTAHLLSALVHGLVVVEHPDGLARAWEKGLVPVALARGFLDAIESRLGGPLPRSWDVTTDSIAAYIATHLGGRELVLLKSAGLPKGTDRREASRLGLVDSYFVEAARDLARVDYICLREPPTRASPIPI